MNAFKNLNIRHHWDQFCAFHTFPYSSASSLVSNILNFFIYTSHRFLTKITMPTDRVRKDVKGLICCSNANYSLRGQYMHYKGNLKFACVWFRKIWPSILILHIFYPMWSYFQTGIIDLPAFLYLNSFDQCYFIF